MPELFLLTEAQMARLAPLLPDDTRGVPPLPATVLEARTALAVIAERRRVDDRRVISGIVHVLKSGCR